MATAQTDKGFRFTGWHFLAIMVAFFGVIITVNATMATFAVKNWTGLVVKNSYVASQQFNDQMKAARAQNAKGWNDELVLADGLAKWSITDKEGKPVFARSATLMVSRPVGENHDQTLELKPDAQGHLSAPIAELGDGRWLVRLTAELDNGESFKVRRGIVVQNGAIVK